MAFTVLNHTHSLKGVASAATNMLGATLIIVYQLSNPSVSTSSITDNQGNTYTALTKYSAGSTAGQFLYCVNPTVTSTMTFTAGNTSADCMVLGVSGQATSPTDQINGATRTAETNFAFAAGSITPTQDNELVVFALGGTFGSLPDATVSGYTTAERYGAGSAAFSGGMYYQIQTTATATNPAANPGDTINGLSASITSWKVSTGGLTRASGFFL